MTVSLKPMQDKIAIADFKKRCTALHSSANNGANALIELGREINQFIESELYLAECPTIGAFFKKNFNWSEQYVSRLRRAANISNLAGLLPDPEGEAPSTPEKALRTAKSSRSTNPSPAPDKSPNPGLKPYVDIGDNKTTSSIPPNGDNKPVKPAKDVDEIGTVIPESLLPLWNRRGELGALIRQVESIRSEIITRKKESDPLFVKVAQEIIGHLDWIHKELVDATPDMVCGICQGRHVEIHKGFCKSCGSTGFMSKYEFKTLVPEEWAKIRKQK